MNARVHSTRAKILLRDGREFEVASLRVGLEHAMATGLRERRIRADGKPDGAWRDIAAANRESDLATHDISQVKIRTDRTRWGWIGGITGAIVGSGIGAETGHGIAKANASPCSPLGSYAYDNDCELAQNVKEFVAFTLGGAAGAALFSLIGVLLGARGVERTYWIAPSATKAADPASGAAADAPAPWQGRYSSCASYSSISLRRACASASRMRQNPGLRFSLKAAPPSLPSGMSNQSG
jgi:hypothetical protein